MTTTLKAVPYKDGYVFMNASGRTIAQTLGLSIEGVPYVELPEIKYTEGDMRSAVSAGLSIGYGVSYNPEKHSKEIDAVLQSLRPKIESIEVDVTCKWSGNLDSLRE